MRNICELFQGQDIAYNPDDPTIDMALMFGFVRVDREKVMIANRIFEMLLSDKLLVEATV